MNAHNERIFNGGKADRVVMYNPDAVAHAGWLRSMLDLVVGTVLPRDAVCCNNCTIAVFEYTGSKWRLHNWMNLLN